MIPAGRNLCETHFIGPKVKQRGVHALQCEPLRARGIWSVGWASIEGRYEVVRLRPDFEHLTVCIAGEGLSLIGGTWIPWREGAMVLSPRGAPHGARSLRGPGNGKWVLAWISFVSATGESSRLPQASAVMLPGRHQPLHALLEGLEREMTLGNDPVSVFHWVELIARFTDRVLLRSAGDPRLAALWNRIQNRIGDPWTVRQMTREVDVSGAHLRRLCRKELGFGPNRQLARLRLKHAALLLSHTAMTVEKIAGKVGYSDAFAFSTAFRRQTGVSPRRFRASSADTATTPGLP